MLKSAPTFAWRIFTTSMACRIWGLSMPALQTSSHLRPWRWGPQKHSTHWLATPLQQSCRVSIGCLALQLPSWPKRCNLKLQIASDLTWQEAQNRTIFYRIPLKRGSKSYFRIAGFANWPFQIEDCKPAGLAQSLKPINTGNVKTIKKNYEVANPE